MPGTPHRGAATYSLYCARNNIVRYSLTNTIGHKVHWVPLTTSSIISSRLVYMEWLTAVLKVWLH